MRLRSKMLTAFLGVALISAVGGALALVQISRLHRAAYGLGVEAAGQLDAIMEMQLAAAQSHLWLEEILIGAESTDRMSEVLSELDGAASAGNAVIHGGDSEGVQVIASKDPTLTDRLEISVAQVAAMKEAAQQRFEVYRQTGGYDFTLDNLYDQQFEQFFRNVRAGEAVLNQLMVKRTAELNQTRANAMSLLILATAVSLGVALLISFTFAGGMAKRFSNMVEFGRIVSGGDFTAEVAVRTGDEIGDMGRSLNHFSDSLSGMLARIRITGDRLAETGLDLASNMEETAAAMGQIATNIGSIRDETVREATSVTESSASVEQILRNIESLGRLIEEQSASVTQSSASIEEMVANIHSVSKNVNRAKEVSGSLQSSAADGREVLSRASREVDAIASQSEALLEANKIIAQIAAQTNLLAMNAAIEAAHAGDYGRGFAVVADEIRSLAENASVQSKNVQRQLKSIKKSIDMVVESSRRSEKSFEEVEKLIHDVAHLEEEIEQSMAEQSSGSTQVLEALSQINQITAEVKDGSVEMKEGSAVVLTELRNLVQNSRSVRQSIEEMSAGVQEVNMSISHVSEISTSNRELVHSLVGEVSQFQIKQVVEEGETQRLSVPDDEIGSLSDEDEVAELS